MSLLTLKEMVDQINSVKYSIQFSRVKLSHQVGMNVRLLNLRPGQQLFQPTAPSVYMYSATHSKQSVAISSARRVLNRPKPRKEKPAPNANRQKSPLFPMRACGVCSMICKSDVHSKMRSELAAGQEN